MSAETCHLLNLNCSLGQEKDVRYAWRTPFYNDNLLKYKALSMYIALISTHSPRSWTLLSKSRWLAQSPSLNPNPEV